MIPGTIAIVGTVTGIKRGQNGMPSIYLNVACLGPNGKGRFYANTVAFGDVATELAESVQEGSTIRVIAAGESYKPSAESSWRVRFVVQHILDVDEKVAEAPQMELAPA